MEGILPEWLEQHKVDTGPGAYGDLEPELRACLKSQIAFLFSHYGECRPEQGRRSTWLERNIFEEESPVSWAMYIMAPDYASGPGALAALMPALLAGVREILICRVADSEPAARQPAKAVNFGALPLSISAALELSGLDQVYDLDVTEATRLLGHLGTPSRGGDGRVVLLGSAPAKPLNSLMCEVVWSAMRLHIPAVSLPGRLKIAVDQFCSADYELLRWAHPQADIYTVERGTLLEPCDALVTDLPESFQPGFRAMPGCGADELPESRISTAPQLSLQPGNEFLWLWNSIYPNFFRKRKFAICKGR
ncbi:hypothetical protein LJC48_00040 [Desulfovibrio sp. OttesenSCG-928-C06]|nr:hypothetical protein [Desulfovibrio sp. OttesenSCG-928-C06]